MPKQVDHGERRRQVAEALWRVTAEHGLEAVTLRQVAAEAGVSMGLVQHYFSGKDEMLLFAYECLRDRAGARVAALDLPAEPRARVRVLLVDLLPLDADRVVEAQVAVAFLARAAVRPEIAAVVREGQVWLRDFLAADLRAAGVRDAEHEADVLLALHDGLVGHVVSGYRTAARARGVLEGHLDRLLG
ncbi:MAG: TetR family transcriptional regulator C-terminal domain-containing protein [Umezawaea sp.]